MFKLNNFGVILFVSFSYKNCYNVHFMKILKLMQKSIFPQKFKKVCVLQRRACNKFKISNAISKTTTIQKIRKNKNAPFFMNFLIIIKKDNFFPTGLVLLSTIL